MLWRCQRRRQVHCRQSSTTPHALPPLGRAPSHFSDFDAAETTLVISAAKALTGLAIQLDLPFTALRVEFPTCKPQSS